MMQRGLTRRRALQGGAVAAGAFASGLGAAIVPARAQQQTLKLAFPDTAAHPTNKVAQSFAKAVEEKTQGRLKVQVYPGGTLGSETNIVAGLQTGIIDFTMHTAGYTSSYVPTIGALDIPFLFKDKPTAQRVLAGPVGKQLAADALAKNIVVLGWSQNGWRNVETVGHPVNTPADIKNLKIRIQAGPIFAATFKTLGAVPVVMDAADLYVALQQKTVDGLEIPVPSTISFKTYEIAKYISLTRHVYNATLFMASKPKFTALSATDQEIVNGAGADASKYWFDLMGQADDEAIEFCKRHGSQVVEADYAAFRAACAPVYDIAKERYGELVQKLIDAAAA